MLIIVMLLGAGAVYMVLRKIYAALWYKNLTVRIDFSKKNAVCGETIELIETVTNKKRLPLPYINLKFQVNRAFRFEDGEENSVVSDNTYRNDIFSLMMYQKVTRKIPIKCTKRGIYSIGRADMVSSGLFMNDINLVGTNQNANIVVFPKQINPELTDITFSKIMGAVEKNTYLNPDIFEFRGIREYDTHDTMNMINWKASARTGQLMVNQYKETMCQSVCILANVEPEGMLKQELLSEITISMASGLAQYLISQKINVSLISNLVTADTSTKYEFEDGVINGTSMEITEDSSASGGQYVYMKDAGDTVTVTVDVEETGMYDLAICYHLPQTMGSDKVQKLNVNGVNQGQIGFVMNDGFEELDIGMYKLNAGQNEIQLESFWGWTYFDYLTVKSADMPDLNVAKTLSDKKATDQTKRLMSYLVDNYGEHIISGQQEIYKYGPHDFEYEFEYIKNLTGVYPAIRGFDYLNECNILYGSEDGTTDRMIDWAKNKNGIITASWHVTVPKNFASYNVGDKVDYSQATYSVKDDNGNYVSDFDTSKAIIEGEKEYESI